MGIEFDGKVNGFGFFRKGVNNNERAEEKTNVPIGQPKSPAEAPEITELTDIRAADVESCRNAFGVHFTRNTAVTDELRLNKEFTKEILSLYPKTGFASQALASFTPEEHEQYVEIMMGLSPFMQNLDKLSS